jgi:Ca2+-binding EF-hand superfamily protein
MKVKASTPGGESSSVTTIPKATPFSPLCGAKNPRP